MKKFRLKPLGELREKFSMNWFFIGLLMTLCVSACSDDDDNVVPTFPEKQTINTEANKTHQLTFDAATNWQLTTSATWCSFVVDGGEEFSLSGGAGKQTITLKVTDEAQSAMEKTMAQVTLAMGNERAIIANVVRSVKGLELKIYDEEGNEIQEITAGYKEYKSFVVKANFHFAATNRPEWAEIKGGAIVGSATKEVTAGVQIVNEAKYAKYEQKGKITFADDKGLYAIDIPLVYNGMNRDEIEISGPSAWNWEVSLDGQTFTQTSSISSSIPATYDKFVPFTIQAYDDDFVPVYVSKVDIGYGYYSFNISVDSESEPVEWMHLLGENGSVKVTVDSSEEEREGYILVFPKEVYDALDNEGDWWSALIENNMETGTQDIKSEYLNNNLVMAFKQKEKKADVETQAFKVTYQEQSETGIITKEITCTKVTDEGIIQDLGTTEVYTIPQIATSIDINPLMDGEWTFKAFIGDNNVTGDICVRDLGYNPDVINAYFEKSLSSDELYIYIKEGNDEYGPNKKVLIITPNN